jgi:hypothetical protein
LLLDAKAAVTTFAFHRSISGWEWVNAAPMLLDAGADVAERVRLANQTTMAPLCFADLIGTPSLIPLLFEHGASVLEPCDGLHRLLARVSACRRAVVALMACVPASRDVARLLGRLLWRTRRQAVWHRF